MHIIGWILVGLIGLDILVDLFRPLKIRYESESVQERVWGLILAGLLLLYVINFVKVGD